MSESGKSTSIVSSFSFLLLKAWNEWDVRGMVLLSLLLQIILSMLGNRRKYTNNLFTGLVLWIAYLSEDWVAIATLGKLSSSCPASPTTNILRAFWAPLLILHLGGPDTITAYAYVDSKLWTRHLLILLVKVVWAIYVIFLSWTPSWLSFFTLPLIIAGIAKYVERILCLKLNNSQKTKRVFSFLKFSHLQRNFDESQPTSEPLLRKNVDVFAAYILLSLMRPDVNNYLSYSLSTANQRINACIEENFQVERKKAKESVDDLVKVVTTLIRYILHNAKDHYVDVVTTELGLIFDFVYTKFALIYSKTGCFLRLTSFACSFLVLLLFLISIMNESKFHFSKVDIYITGILLSGVIALELYAAWVMFSSDWAILVAALHHNVLACKIFWVILKCFPCFLNQRKRWSNHMGQFDLLRYCWHYKKKYANKSSVCIPKITYCGDLIEMWRKYKITYCGDLIEMWRKFMGTEFVKVPNCLMKLENVCYPDSIVSFFHGGNIIKASTGERALQARQQHDKLKWSIELDFDYGIIIWHLATSVCFYHDSEVTDARKISECVSNYMMDLLVIRPTMLLLEDSKSFWLDYAYDELKELFFPATDIKAASTLLLELDDDDYEENRESSNSALGDVRKSATSLNKVEDKWEMIKEVWLEILLFAAFSSSNFSHVKQLGDGGEFLSLLWLYGGRIFISKVHHH